MPLPLLNSYKQILYPTPDVAQHVDDIVTNRIPFPANGKNGIIIFGPTGTGKTSLMKLLPDAVESYRTGSSAYLPLYVAIDEITKPTTLFTLIKNQSSNIPLYGSYNYFLLDEIDLLKSTGMKSLKSVMELKYTIFIFATNDLSSIDTPIMSRSHLIDMRPPPPEAALQLAKDTLFNAGVTKQIPDNLLIDLISNCHGDIRTMGSEIDRLIAKIMK